MSDLFLICIVFFFKEAESLNLETLKKTSSYPFLHQHVWNRIYDPLDKTTLIPFSLFQILATGEDGILEMTKPEEARE